MTPRAIWITLFVSLAVNVFALGAFVGVRMSEARTAVRDGPSGVPTRVGNPLAEAIRGLPPEAQAAWRDQNRAFTETAGPEIRQARQQTREALRALGDDPLDTEAALTALRRARAAEHQARAAMDQRLVDFAADLTPEDRRAFAEALARGASRSGPPLRERPPL